MELRSRAAAAPPPSSLVRREIATEALAVHLEITNALAGLRGQTQLLLRGPAAAEPGTRDRLEAILRESDRIERTIARLRALELGEECTGAPSHGA